jgi:3-oxoacyl-[acyl-carrier protein] reductase
MLTGKIALITGGSSGIGEAIAHNFAQAGATVAVVASSSAAKAEAVCEAIRAEGGTASSHAVDVRNAAAVAALVDEVCQSHGGIDILVNSAGVYYPTVLAETPIEDSERMIDINIKGVWNCVDAVLPRLKERGGGKIVNVSSVAAYVGIGGFAIYCATKAAIKMMTRSLACDLAPFDININAIAPGNTETPMNEGFRTDPANAEYIAAMEKATPSNTTFSKPEEIADVARFLVSSASRAMHGSTVLIDEGISAGLG